MRALLALPFLAACATAAPPPVADAPARDRIAAECLLLRAATVETASRGLRVWPDVLEGCPDQPDARRAMTLPQMSAATRAANSARLPEGARAMGPRADLVFRRMITRGVPVAVAEAMTTGPEFAAAAR